MNAQHDKSLRFALIARGRCSSEKEGMIQDDEKQQSDAQVEREIRGSRRFTPEEALGRIAGPGAMKGASPVSPQQQAEIEIGTWLRSHLTDPAGALKVV